VILISLEVERPKIDEKVSTTTDFPYIVILFNDDYHSFDEVIIQLIKALKCDINTAKNFAFQAHINGKTAIYNGSLAKCLQITSILAEIGLNTEIET